MQVLTDQWLPSRWLAPLRNHAHAAPTCGQLLEDGCFEGGGLQLANLGGRRVPPGDGELGRQVGAGGGGGGGQLPPIAISLQLGWKSVTAETHTCTRDMQFMLCGPDSWPCLMQALPKQLPR